MAVRVDQLKTYPESAIKGPARRFGRVWCHLTADDLNELHYFAMVLGLKRSWFQDHTWCPHYDLTPNMRALALRLGAEETTTREEGMRQLAAHRRRKQEG